jgi:pyridoxine/pyridoxamine 5'-phosphate oxidase
MLPDDIKKSLEQDFYFSTSLVFCQFATQLKNQPQVRTVRCYGIEKELGLIFVTRNISQKWNALKENPKLALCFLDSASKVQLRAECEANLLDHTSSSALFNKYWNRVGDDVKKIYHDEYIPNSPYSDQKEFAIPEIVPHCFGIIAAVPCFWEYLLIEPNYQKSVRCVYTRNQDDIWNKQRLTMS